MRRSIGICASYETIAICVMNECDEQVLHPRVSVVVILKHPIPSSFLPVTKKNLSRQLHRQNSIVQAIASSENAQKLNLATQAERSTKSR